MENHSPLADLWAFARTRKKLWVLPLVLVLLMLALLMYMVEGSTVSPFVYTLF
ncbi:MAG: hypothetical protein H6617_04120 [Bdellovibrionaceae bacterium]|nr:hypothetical protein [Pseudobdellovibrionaceae bacterium]